MFENEKLKLKQWRVLKDFSREELANKAGLTSRTLYNYENDVKNLRKASYETLEKIAEALEISVNQIFLGGISEKPNYKEVS